MCLAGMVPVSAPPKPVAKPKFVSPMLIEAARVAASLNAERRSTCTPDQKVLRDLFDLNARLFEAIAS